MRFTKLKEENDDSLSNEPVPHSKFQKAFPYIQTSVMYITFISLGCSSITASFMVGLADNINVNVTAMGTPLSVKSVGVSAGTLLGGVAFDWFKNKQMLLVALSLVMSVVTYLIPICRSIYALCVDLGILGTTMAAIDIGVNILCLRLWDQESGPFYQALHFSYGTGNFLGTGIATLFLLNQKNGTDSHNDSPFNSTEYVMEFRNNSTNTTDTGRSNSQMIYAYAIVGSIGVLAAILWMMMNFCKPKNEECNELSIKEVEIKLPSTRFTTVTVVIAGLMVFLIVGMETAFSQLLPVFAYKGGFISTESESSALATVFWASYMVTRFLCIFFVSKIRHTAMIAVEFALTFTGSIILVLLSGRFTSCLWIGSALIGVGLASLFPTTMNWVDRHINLTNKVASIIIVMAGIAGMLVPNLEAYVTKYPSLLFYFMLLSSILFGIFFTLLAILFTRQGEKYVQVKDLQEQNNISKDSKQKEMQEKFPSEASTSNELHKPN